MAEPIIQHSLHLLFFISFLLFNNSEQLLQPSEIHAIWRIHKLLKYPSPLSSSLSGSATDFCNTEPTPSLTLVCYENSITQLHITGNIGFPPLPQDFSSSSFFSIFSTLPKLKVLSLVSLGLWGPLPSTIATLSSLEILNISTNCFYGTLPVEISSLHNLQALVLDNNRFTGPVPNWLSSLPVLAVLRLKNNSLSGSLPNSLSRLKSLRVLVLSMNHLSGEVPNLGNLTYLQVLHLEDNNLGPHFPNVSHKLVSLVLRKNRFGFGLPDDLRTFYQLHKLDISSNEFVGPFAPSLLSLPWLTYLDISGNKFTGLFTKNTSCGAELVYANFTSNRLTGDLPTCLQSESKKRAVFYGQNCLSNRGGHGHEVQHPYSFCQNEALAVKVLPPKPREKRPHGKVVFASSFVGSFVGGMALFSLVILVIRREYSGTITEVPRTRSIREHVSPADTLKMLTDARYISETMKLRPLGIPPYRTFVLEEIKEATSNFDASNLMDKGSHTQVPRLALLSSDWGLPGQKFSWIQRLAAAIGVVRGIQFLHTGIVPGVFSNNLRITDVLLDQDFHVKISRYNLPLLAENRRLVCQAQLHLFVPLRLSYEDKNDVYDLGVILLEIIVGRAMVSHNDVSVAKDLLLVSLSADEIGRKSIIDPAIRKECVDESLKTFMELCTICLSNEPTDRPSTEDVLWNLQFAAQVQDSWRRDSKSNQGSPVMYAVQNP
ncbi:hypothetical protein RJ640_006478 [Escallonia rubra]|uniref:Protein kinase domain-containing protein n=1 Tax=Escallonia rubra TaxID=112253 RepID=A0AA88RJ40_9ASTE|nr:hypothetical protein RJ640_006478 [Escallonia rubra]